MERDTPRRQEYRARINRAVDYIEAHLQEELSLEAVARAAYFSPYHFHRIFSALMGETVNQFVQRVRLEKAAFLLRAHPTKPVTRVAMECGYQNPAAFSRAFRGSFGTTPSEWRNVRPESSKDGTAQGKMGKEGEDPEQYPSWEDSKLQSQLPGRTTMPDIKPQEVRVEDLPETTVAYIRHVGPYAGNQALFQELFGRLFAWAGPRNLLRFPETQILSLYHDDPNVTEERKLRLSVGISVPPDTEVSGEVGKLTLPSGRYVQALFELLPHEYGDAWDAVFGGWLPDSGYLPADGQAFERYLNNPKDHPEGKHIVEICVPVKPM